MSEKSPFSGRPGAEQDTRFWELLVHQDPSSPTLLELARQHLSAGEAEEAYLIADRVSRAHPDHLEAALVTARSLVELDRVDHAREVLLNGGWVQSLAERLNELADLMFRLGDADGAQRIGDAAALLEREADYQAESVLAGQAAEAVPTETLAFLYLSQGHEERAIEIYRKILEADPGNEAVRKKLMALRPGEFDIAPSVMTFQEPLTETPPLDLPSASADAISFEAALSEMEVPWTATESPEEAHAALAEPLFEATVVAEAADEISIQAEQIEFTSEVASPPDESEPIFETMPTLEPDFFAESGSAAFDSLAEEPAPDWDVRAEPAVAVVDESPPSLFEIEPVEPPIEPVRAAFEEFSPSEPQSEGSVEPILSMEIEAPQAEIAVEEIAAPDLEWPAVAEAVPFAESEEFSVEADVEETAPSGLDSELVSEPAFPAQIEPILVLEAEPIEPESPAEEWSEQPAALAALPSSRDRKAALARKLERMLHAVRRHTATAKPSAEAFEPASSKLADSPAPISNASQKEDWTTPENSITDTASAAASEDQTPPGWADDPKRRLAQKLMRLQQAAAERRLEAAEAAGPAR